MKGILRVSVSPWFKRYLILVIMSAPIFGFSQQTMFTRVYLDLQGFAQAYATVKTPDNCIGLAGYKDMLPLALKADSMGNILWDKKIGNAQGAFYSVTNADDTCLVFAGYVDDGSGMMKDLLFVKTNKDGDTVWTRKIDMGSGEETAWSVEQTSDGGFIAAGASQTDIPPFSQAVLIKLDPQGAIVWSKLISFGDSAASAFSARQTIDGGYIVTGICDVTFNYIDGHMFMLKLTPDGEAEWSRVVQFGSGESSGLDMIPDPTGMTWLYQSSNAGTGLIRTDALGNPLWGRQYMLSAFFGFFVQSATKLSRTSDGGYIFVDGSPMGPGWTIKTDADGYPVAEESLFLNTIGALETDDGGYLFTGNGPIIGVEMGSTDNPQIGLIKTDEQFNSSGCIYPESVFYDITFLTVFDHPVISVAAGTILASNCTLSDALLLDGYGCVAYIGSADGSSAKDPVLDVFPNPSAGMLTIQMTAGCEDCSINKIEIINSAGVTMTAALNPGNQVDLSNYSPGLYLLRAETTCGILTKRVLVTK